MHIRLGAKMIGQAEALRVLHELSGRQMAVASAKALNDAGFEVRRAMQDEMRAVFKDPTDYILRSPRVKMATPDRLSVTIEPAYMGGKGVDPQKILNAQAWGGRRRDKRSEVALRRAGILPNGYQTAIPERPFPGSDDGRGNLKGSFLVQLISYFQAFGEQGYRANMTAKRKGSIHRGTAKVAGRRYFLGGDHGQKVWTVENGEPVLKAVGVRKSHLAPGIWAAYGPGGKQVAPVLMFVRQGTYTPRLDMDKVAKRADAENYLAKRVRFRIREVAGV